MAPRDNNEDKSSRRDELKAVDISRTTNAGLWLEKYSKDIAATANNAKTIEAIIQNVKIPDAYKLHFNRWKSELEKKQQVKIAKATVQGRMVVGLGAESVLETAITLHRTYGVPFIPGSALKGLASAAAHRFLANDEWRKKTKIHTQGPSHEVLFGNTKTAGFVTFHDALLVVDKDEKTPNEMPLDLDVMTVHHREYYGTGKAPPADWDSPNPVSFVTARGTYLIALEGPEEWVTAALDILEEALREDGIGAKTAAGYGRLRLEGHKTRKERAEEEAIQKKRLEEQKESNKKEIENLKKGLNMGNARDVVPKLLNKSVESERMTLAKSIIKALKSGALKAKGTQPWVQDLFKAAGEPLP